MLVTTVLFLLTANCWSIWISATALVESKPLYVHTSVSQNPNYAYMKYSLFFVLPGRFIQEDTRRIGQEFCSNIDSFLFSTRQHGNLRVGHLVQA